MDSLPVDIAGVATALNQILARYSAGASSTLFLIKSQVRSLQVGVDDVREWVHLTDATSSAQLSRRLQDVAAIVKPAAVRLWYDLESIRQSLPEAGSNAPRKAGFAFDEARMRLHLCDMRECAALVHLASATCQSPAMHADGDAAGELRLATKLLLRVHSTAQQERRIIIHDHLNPARRLYSTTFNEFAERVTSAEDDLDQQATRQLVLPRLPRAENTLNWSMPMPANHGPHAPATFRNNPTRPVVAEKPITSGGREQSPRLSTDEEPSEKLSRSSSSSSLLTAESFTTDATQLDSGWPGQAWSPLTETRRRSNTSHQYQRAVVRIPVRSSGSRGSSSAITVPRPVSVSGVRQRDALLAVASVPATLHQSVLPEMRTSRLFQEAKGSLAAFEADLNARRLDEYVEGPPPYIQSSSSSPWTTSAEQSDTQTSYSGGGGATDVFRAIRENKTSVLRNLLEQGCPADATDNLARRTALMEAATLRRCDAVQLLLDAGVRAHLKDPNGWTALHFAARQGDGRSCKLLLDAGAQLDEYNSDGETPLQLAARGGHTDAVSCLLDNWSTQMGTFNMLLRGFQEASKCGNVSTAQAFIEKGVKPKQITGTWTPLTCAAESGSIPMLNFMLNHHCSLKERSPDGWTALHYAAARGHTSMIEKLLAHRLPWKAQTKRDEETALHLAAINDHTSTALALLAHKDANITMKDAEGQQALHHAVRNGDLALTTALLGQGALMDDVNNYGWQPIHLAAAYGHLHLVADLLTRGVSAEEKLIASSFRPSKRTNKAATRGLWAEIRWPHAGARPLHLALEFGHQEVADVLLASGARIEAADAHGWRPLHYAAFNCRLPMAQRLLALGANPHATTDDNSTPLGLGFRRSGLAVSADEMRRMTELLQAAMRAQKRSKLKQFAGLLSSHSAVSRAAKARNRAWHTAELAAALYHDYDAEAGTNEEGAPEAAASESAFADPEGG